MTRTTTPAPWGGGLGLEFGNTTERPYSPSRPHGGQDHCWRYADVEGSRRLVAPVSGTVTAACNDGSWNQGWGNIVDITVPTNDGTSVVVRLAHLASGSVVARVGQRINAGDAVGSMGSAGETYGQVHLHEELWINGVRVDPIYYRTHDLPGTNPDAEPAPTPVLEDSMSTQSVRLDGRHFFTIGKQYLKHSTTEESNVLARNINSATDELHEIVGLSDFDSYLDEMGIPRDVYRITKNGESVEVLNPEAGQFEEGGVWSRERQNTGLLQRLLASTRK